MSIFLSALNPSKRVIGLDAPNLREIAAPVPHPGWVPGRGSGDVGKVASIEFHLAPEVLGELRQRLARHDAKDVELGQMAMGGERKESRRRLKTVTSRNADKGKGGKG